jgi:hypothetical protein
MRSELIFAAKVHVPNRFLLTRLLAKATRELHKPGARIQDTTNEALSYLSRPIQVASVQADPTLGDRTRRLRRCA